MRLIYDCTVLSKWLGHYTGIQRTVEEVGLQLPTCLPSTLTGIFDQSGICRTYDLRTRETGQPIHIEPGDLIFSAGHDWDYPEHFSVLENHIACGARLGVLFYDIIPIKLPFTYSKDFVARFRHWLNRTVGIVDIAFAISERTRSDILGYTHEHGATPIQIDVVRLGANFPNRNNPSEAIAEKARLPHILSVGTIEYRKNHLVLLNAYRHMLDDLGFIPPKLYIVGKQGYLDGNVRHQVEGDPRLSDRVEVLTGLADDDLQVLYGSALFTVYPSVYEGWGLPVAESLHHGKPCITSRGTSMEEIAPGLVRLAHPLMIQDWARHIQELSDPQTLARETERISQAYQAVTWSETAQAICATLINKYPTLNHHRS